MFRHLTLIAFLIAALVAAGCGSEPPKKKAKGGGIGRLLRAPSTTSADEDDDGEADDGSTDGDDMELAADQSPTIAESDAFAFHSRRWLMQASDEQLLLVRALERFSRQSVKQADPMSGPWREEFDAWRRQVEKLLENREMVDWVFNVRAYDMDRKKLVGQHPTITLDANLGASLDDIKGSTERFDRRMPFIKVTGEGANDDLLAFAQPNYRRSTLRVWGKIKKAKIGDGVALERGGLHFPIEIEIELKQVRHLVGNEAYAHMRW